MDRLLLEFGGILSGHSANPSLAEVGTKPRTLQYLHTEVPDDPVKIARDQRWGQDALSTATDLITHNTTATTNDIGAPAEYDTAIDTSYQHNLGIQKGWIK